MILLKLIEKPLQSHRRFSSFELEEKIYLVFLSSDRNQLSLWR